MTDHALPREMDDFSYGQEINRKLLHLSSLWIPFSIYHLSQSQATMLIGFAFALSLAFEALRRQEHMIAAIARRIFDPLIRKRENRAWFCLTGSTYMLAASLLVTLLFPKPIAILSLSIMLIGDTAAALVGRRYGKTRILDKSLEGSAAFLSTAWISVIAISSIAGFPHYFMTGGLIAAIAAAAVELVSGALQLDDNLTVTLAAACTMLLVIDGF